MNKVPRTKTTKRKSIEFDINPMAKPRMTRSDKWKQRDVVIRYFQWKDSIEKTAKKEKFELPNEYEVTFFVQMPKSWSEKKRRKMKHQPHVSRPDLDNLLKALNDSLCEEDSQIWKVKAEKVWSIRGSIIIKYE